MELLKGITSDHELIELADKLNIDLDGITTMEEVSDKLGKGSFILLLRARGGVGHWVAYHGGEYFDSTGVGPPTKLGEIKYNQFQYQGTYNDFCGIYCLLWLYSKQKNKPELLKGFTNLDRDFV